MTQDKWSDKAVVEQVRAIPRHRQEAPSQEKTLQKPVEWNPKEKNIREKLHKAENTVDDPVGQPLGVIIFSMTFYRFHRGISRINKPMKLQRNCAP
uniref:Uncharacterized protein n=1 Tax=Arion vulgaris TaxID=1028688 RepID=A0A0B7BLX2_9EUPU